MSFLFLNMLVCMYAQSYLTLCDPMDCSPPGSSVHGIFQASTLEWVAISYSRGSSQPRDGTWVSCIDRQTVFHCATWEALIMLILGYFILYSDLCLQIFKPFIGIQKNNQFAYLFYNQPTYWTFSIALRASLSSSPDIYIDLIFLFYMMTRTTRAILDSSNY